MIDRAYMSAHVGRQQREREIRTTTAPIRKHRERSHWSAILAVIAMAGAYASHDGRFVFVALLMAAVAVTQFVWSRRQS